MEILSQGYFFTGGTSENLSLNFFFMLQHYAYYNYALITAIMDCITLELYRVVQKWLDTGSNILNIECQRDFWDTLYYTFANYAVVCYCNNVLYRNKERHRQNSEPRVFIHVLIQFGVMSLCSAWRLLHMHSSIMECVTFVLVN